MNNIPEPDKFEERKPHNSSSENAPSKNPFAHFGLPAQEPQSSRLSPTPTYYPAYSNPPQQSPLTHYPQSYQSPMQPPLAYIPPNQAGDRAASKAATISMIASLLSFVAMMMPILNLILCGVGIIFGHKALRKLSIYSNNDRTLAMVGVCCGYVALVPALFTTGIALAVRITALFQ